MTIRRKIITERAQRSQGERNNTTKRAKVLTKKNKAKTHDTPGAEENHPNNSRIGEEAAEELRDQPSVVEKEGGCLKPRPQTVSAFVRLPPPSPRKTSTSSGRA